MKFFFILIPIIFLSSTSCSNDDDNAENGSPQLIITFKWDENANRLDNLGNPATIPSGNAAQTPDFKVLGLHFAGLYKDKFTPYDNGVTLFSTPTTTAGGINAIEFDSEFFITENENTFDIPLSELQSGTYEYFRTSIGFQKYDIIMNLEGTNTNPTWNDNIDAVGTIASFLGYNTYVPTYQIKDSLVTVNQNKTQGYFGFEIQHQFPGLLFGKVTTGDSGQTTVPNPINATSPVPAGSCVVTGKFPVDLQIPENPTEDINIEVVVSINNSFEWIDGNSNGKWEPAFGETVVDMGTRGLFPKVVN